VEDVLKKKPKKKPPQVFQIGKNYTREYAFKVARKKATRDFRGFTYNPSTGKATLI